MSFSYRVSAPYPASFPIAECADIETACQALRDYGRAPYGLDGCVVTEAADCEHDGLSDEDHDALDVLRRELRCAS